MQKWVSRTLVGLGVCCVGSARADTVFDLNATLTQTGVANPGTATLTGTIAFNTTTGALGLVKISFTNPGSSAYNGTYSLNYFGGPTGAAPTEFGFQGYFAPYQAALFLFLPVSSPLVGYTGGSICSVAYACFNSTNSTIRDDSTVSISGGSTILPFVNTSYTVDSGTLTAETPEPSGWLLVGTGLMGMAGAGLRCFRSRNTI